MSQPPSAKKILTFVISILFFAVVVGYGIWISRYVIFGIKLTVNGITSGQSVTDSVVNLTGTASHAASVTVDGQIVSLSETGTWRDTLALLPGYNVVTIVANDTFGKSATKQLVLYYNTPPPVLPVAVPNTTSTSPSPQTVISPPETSTSASPGVQ